MRKQTVLKNGLRVVSHRMAKMESVSLGIWIGVGGRHEKYENNGITHLVEHLLFKGTKKRNAEKIKNDIEGRGGTFNAFTAEECTCYLIKVLGKDIELGLDVLSDMVLDARLAQEDIDKEKNVIVEEINMYKDLPMQYIHELLAAILWPKQPLGLPLAGTIDSVKSLKRDDIVSFKNQHYQVRNIIVVGAGNVEHDNLMRLADKYLSRQGIGERSIFEKAFKNQTRPNLSLNYKKTEQTHLAIGIHALDRFHPDRYALSVLNVILGANMSSRLFQEVRERLALCYEIASTTRSFHDAGAFVVHAGVDFEKIEKALEVIFRELNKTKVSLVKKDEFERAKEYYKGQLLLGLEGTMSSMLWLGEKIMSGEKDISPKRILDKIDKITPEDLKRVSNTIFKDENLNLAIIGPIKNRRMIEETLHIS